MMQIKINDEVIYTINEVELKVLKDEINSDQLYDIFVQRIIYAISRKSGEISKKMFDQWLYGGLLSMNGVTEVPLNKAELLQLIFSQPNYKDRAARDAEQQSPE